MTKRELIEALKDMDDNAQVMIPYDPYMSEVGEPGVSFNVERVQMNDWLPADIELII